MTKPNDIPSPAKLDLAQPPLRRRLLTRRRFLKLLAGSVTASACGGLYANRIEPHWIEVVRRDLPLENLPDALAGRTLALVSDLHIGPVVDGDYIRGAISRINDLRPDLLAITGDFMTSRAGEQIDNVADVLGGLHRPPLGTFACLGNHDYGHGWFQPAVARNLAGRLAGLNIRVLRNELAEVGQLQVLGMHDLWARDYGVPGGSVYRARHEAGHEEGISHVAPPGNLFDLEAVLPAVDPGRPAIMLMHNPDGVDAGDWSSFRGWILAGHSHGGQVDLPLYGPPLLPLHNPRYARGEIDLGAGQRLYVNRGLGYLWRVRFNCRPEITLFTLRRA